MAEAFQFISSHIQDQERTPASLLVAQQKFDLFLSISGPVIVAKSSLKQMQLVSSSRIPKMSAWIGSEPTLS